MNIVECNSVQWFRNGDHPLDYANSSPEVAGPEHEGQVVKYFRHPYIDGQSICKECGNAMQDHGWLDDTGDGEVVCPGSWIVKRADGYHASLTPDPGAGYIPVYSDQ